MHFQGEVMEDQQQVYQIKKPQTALGESASKKTCHKEAPDTEFIYLFITVIFTSEKDQLC